MKNKDYTNKMSKEDKIIKDIDTNGNGRITKKELKAYLKDKDITDKKDVCIECNKVLNVSVKAEYIHSAHLS